MALIDCPECGRQVSSSASACPGCAYPLVSGAFPAPTQVAAEPERPKWWKTALGLAARLAVGMMLIAAGLGEDEPSGVVGGLIIGGSAIPAWYRAKFGRLRLPGTGRRLGNRLEERLAEIERRHREEMEQLQETHAGHMADLEERLDFTERVLTRNREQIKPG